MSHTNEILADRKFKHQFYLLSLLTTFEEYLCTDAFKSWSFFRTARVTTVKVRALFAYLLGEGNKTVSSPQYSGRL